MLATKRSWIVDTQELGLGDNAIDFMNTGIADAHSVIISLSLPGVADKGCSLHPHKSRLSGYFRAG
jgi:hypothetical protein